MNTSLHRELRHLPTKSFLIGAREHNRGRDQQEKGNYRGSFSLLFLYFPEEVLSGSGEVLELENPGIVPWEILFGVPWRSPEALQPPVLLEPKGQIPGKTNYFTIRCLASTFCGPQGLTPSEGKGSKANVSFQKRS